MKKLITQLLVFVMLLTTLLGSITVSATSISPDVAYLNLKTACETGKYTGSKILDNTSLTYECSGGGYKTYNEITGNSPTDSEEFFIETNYSLLTGSAKQAFLKDMLNIANAMVYDTDAGNGLGGGVTSQTVDMMYRVLQNKAGMGSQLLATLMSETKPDYATAQKMFAPFSGPIGTALALISILIMALLGVTMALDIAYIVIPPVQLFFGGTGDGSGKDGNKMSGWISHEARQAVAAATGGSNGQGGSGEYKAAIGIYLKYRWLGLVLLGICILYLVQGQIYNFVAWFIDLFSGFLGF